MALRGVVMASDVYMVCQNHALCTDQEEIMGLLIGEIKARVCYVSALIMLRRSDKRKDRVEISPVQLTLAASYAEELQRELNKPMTIVGWYHSHPHITVWPSHVDLRTQAMYQGMQPYFAGIIFSVFTEDKASKEQEFHMTCFQSVDGSRSGDPPTYERVDIPLIIGSQCLTKPCLETMIKLAEILVEEENEAFELANSTNNLSTIGKMMNEAVQLYSFLRITDEVTLPLCSALENMRDRYEEECEEDQKIIERVQTYTEDFCAQQSVEL